MIDIETLPTLSVGSHEDIAHGMCVMEAVSYVSGERWSDHPECASHVISAFLRYWNDTLPDDERDALLRPLIPRLIGTRANRGVENRRAIMAADWLIRTHTPAWLRLARLTAQADSLASLPEITKFAQCFGLIPTLNVVRSDAAAARAACGDAARAAAGPAAWAAAWAGAGYAARDSAASAAGDAARAAAGAAGARDSAWDSAWDAAGDAAWAAAWAGAGYAARDAAWAALSATRLSLQQSALELVNRMIEAR
jgi:hypothetical protein